MIGNTIEILSFLIKIIRIFTIYGNMHIIQRHAIKKQEDIDFDHGAAGGGQKRNILQADRAPLHYRTRLDHGH